MLYRIAKYFRFLLFLIVALAVTVPTALYLLLSSDWAQHHMRSIAEQELSQWLGTKVNIGRVHFQPLSSLTIDSVSVNDDNDSTALLIANIDARFETWDFIFKRKIIIDYADVTGIDLHLYRDDEHSPLNIQKIIDKVAKKEPGKPPAHFSLRLNDLTLRDCAVKYDVWSKPETPGQFNPAHIAVSNLNLNAFAPTVADSAYHVWLRHLSLTEASGLTIKQLSAELDLTKTRIALSDLQLKMPQTRVVVGNFDIPIDGFDKIASIGRDIPVTLSVLDGSHVYLPDLKAFAPVFGNLDYDINMEVETTGNLDHIDISKLRLSDANRVIELQMHGAITGLSNVRTAVFEDVVFDIQASQQSTNIISTLLTKPLPGVGARAIDNIGDLKLTGSIDGTLSDASIDASMHSALAVLTVNGTCKHPQGSDRFDLILDTDIDSLQLGTLIDNTDFNRLSAALSLNGSIDQKNYCGEISADVRHFDFKGHSYRDIEVRGALSADDIDLTAVLPDHFANIKADIKGSREGGTYTCLGSLDIARFQPDSLNLKGILPGMDVCADIKVDAFASSLDRFAGDIEITDLGIIKTDGRRLNIGKINIETENLNNMGHLWLSSDYLDGSVNGQFDLASIRHAFRHITCKVLPALAPKDDKHDNELTDTARFNRFAYDFSFVKPQELCRFFDLPVTVIDKAEISGTFNELSQTAMLSIDVPWILQGSNKVIRNTALTANINGIAGSANLYCTSHIPTKKGPMELMATINGHDGDLTTDIDWEIIRSIPINGKIRFITNIFKNAHERLGAKVNFDNSEINFGDDTWRIQPSTLIYDEGELQVNNLAMNTMTEGISINGVAGKNDYDELTINLSNIQLINIFETLEIDNALISGFATGTIYANGLLGQKPEIKCESLKVKDIGYNYCTLGDANVRLDLQEGGQLFVFDADITNPEGQMSYLDGSIRIPTEELDLNIQAEHIKVGFMKPFMQAFTSDVSGYASGNAHLYGTFHDIDLTGDIMTKDLRIKIDFTNTWYSAADSIHIHPGIIDLKDIRIYDELGNSALLNGFVGHTYFHNAVFDFTISDAHNFLCYDVPEKLSPIWYGRIFGDGKANIKGRPGVVDIGVNMTTADNSIFTFVLSDQEEADEYSFITFRDATVRAVPDSVINRPTVPDEVLKAEALADNAEDDQPTAYNMDIQMGITPQAQIVIVMDPIGGDRIRSRGRGTMRMRYSSSDNDLRLNGRYTLDQGSYNFTLQDIIIKDFTIKQGSSITFNGDPYSAQLDLQAYYQVNANLSDLDESFLQDKELNRTNVPVRALLNVTGDMRQPDISFDLEFPTLTTDVYRKVRSIVSTEDMMNRQIIYLLALNRFYTPEYMASTTKGNEIFSVASSTISSQLSSMLGKLSDNWSIAPNLRSDRGDFSDIEVDVTLSSSLLNNRLLFNGNFGYRDKSLNTNQFIGDFDIEYLLNRTGSWRLKAYNRYNDQNYYLRTAQTTQGVGFVYKRDFDNIFSFLRRKKEATDTVPDDTRIPTAVDTLIVSDTLTIIKPTQIIDTNH